MTMYKGLIVFVTVLIIGGAGYYFHQAGVPDLVTQDIKQGGNGKGYGVSAVEVFSGIYECTETTGCEHLTRLILAQDTTLDVVAVIDGQEVSYGQGTWGVGSNGAIVIIINNPADAPSGSPKSLIANKVSSLTISGFSMKKGLYPGMKNPVFTRVVSTDEKNTQGAN